MSTITLYTRNILESGTVTVTGTPDTGYPEERLWDRSIDLFWKDTATAQYIFHIDQGATVYDVSAVIVPKHNFNGKTMSFQWSSLDFAGDIHNMVSPWVQGDNLLFIKSATGVTSRYWRMVGTGLVNPMCSEIFMSEGAAFTVQKDPAPEANELANVQWNRTIGGSERATKHGDERRVRDYELFLSAADLTAFRAEMDNLDGYSKPFFITDHEGDTWACRFSELPIESFDNPTYTHVSFTVIEEL